MEHESANWRGVLADVERAATRGGRAGLGCYLIEGTRLHERALRAGAQLRDVLVAERYLCQADSRARRLLAELKSAGCPTHRVPDRVIERLTAGREIGAILGLVRIPGSVPLRERIEAARDSPQVVLVGVDIEDPGNVGALIRTSLAGGAELFAAVGITEPYHPRAVRTSMGSIFRLPVERYVSLTSLAEELQTTGVRSYGATTRGGVPIHQVRFGPGPVALVIGSEAFGLDDSEQSLVGQRVSIPMQAPVDSYSVNAAAAILLYEVRRPRSGFVGP